MRNLLRRSTLAVVIAILASGAAVLSLPRVTVACSCVAPADIIEMAAQGPEATVFTAIAGPKAGRDIPVSVTRWFRGVPAIGPMVLEGGPDDDLCGPTSPAPGREFLFVTYPTETSRYAINGCSVQADVDSPDGKALLAKATALFGGGQVVTGSEPAEDPSGGPIDIGAVVPVVLIGLFGVGAFTGAIAILRRRESSEGRSER